MFVYYVWKYGCRLSIALIQGMPVPTTNAFDKFCTLFCALQSATLYIRQYEQRWIKGDLKTDEADIIFECILSASTN